MLSIALKSPVPIYEQLVDGIQSMIKGGKLKPGDSLPPIRALASQLEISINTVARAYMELERVGLIESNGRKGSFVKNMESLPGAVPANIFKENILTLIRNGLEKDQIITLFNQNINEIYS